MAGIILSKEWTDTLAAQLGGILDCTYSAEDTPAATDDGITSHKARINIIPSKNKPTAGGAITIAGILNQPISLSQGMALGQNEDLETLINRYVNQELQGATGFSTEVLQTRMGGQSYELETKSGDIVGLRITTAAGSSDSGSVAIKIDYDGAEQLPGEVQAAVTTFRSALIAAFSKAAPEFMANRKAHDEFLGNSVEGTGR